MPSSPSLATPASAFPKAIPSSEFAHQRISTWGLGTPSLKPEPPVGVGIVAIVDDAEFDRFIVVHVLQVHAAVVAEWAHAGRPNSLITVQISSSFNAIMRPSG